MFFSKFPLPSTLLLPPNPALPLFRRSGNIRCMMGGNDGGQGGTIPQAPNHYRCPEWLRRAPKSPYNVASNFFKTVRITGIENFLATVLPGCMDWIFQNLFFCQHQQFLRIQMPVILNL